jgi:hypothetical protein
MPDPHRKVPCLGCNGTGKCWPCSGTGAMEGFTDHVGAFGPPGKRYPWKRCTACYGSKKCSCCKGTGKREAWEQGEF